MADADFGQGRRRALNLGDNISLGGGVNDSTEAQDAVRRSCPTSIGHVWDTG